ncbi:SGNH/GDSL hydrolase family protein [Jiella sp. CBK1P-4]|uniref:SGNH/GDSL hydrolase family protein n=2 Tax=Jiella avicenniae TaxID=2907202 RepID=A0A9X1NZ46_9HYPH|nr:SGNH/GDSL hydrolase family protein [Jiella avicenniae]
MSSTVNLPSSATVSELVGNADVSGVKTTVRVAYDDLSAQLLASGPLSDTIEALSAAVGDPDALQDILDAISSNLQLETRLNTTIDGTVAAGLPSLSVTTKTSVGTTGHTDSIADNTFFWSPMIDGALTDRYLTGLDISVAAATTGKAIVVSPGNVVSAEVALNLPSSGVNALTLDRPIFVPAGGRVFVQIAAGFHYSTGASGSSVFFAASDYNGTVGDTVGFSGTNTPLLDLVLRFSVPVGTPLASRVAANEVKSAKVFAGLPSADSTGAATGTWGIGAPAITVFEKAYDGGVDIASGDVITAIFADLIAAATCDHFLFMICKRATSVGDGAYDFGASGPAIRVARRTPAQLGLTPGVGATARVSIPVDPVIVEAGQSYFIFVASWGANQLSRVSMGLGNQASTDPRQRRRGRYTGLTSATATPTTNVTALFQGAVGFTYAKSATSEGLGFDTVDAEIASATIGVTGTTYTASGTIEQSGGNTAFSGSGSVSLAASGNARYDLLYVDMTSGAMGVQTGTETPAAPGEYIPAIASQSRRAVAHLRVSDSVVTHVPVWDLQDHEPRDLIEALRVERERSRRCLPKTIAKIRRGDPLHIVVMSDSILACQSSAPSKATPNGATRDRPEYFSANIPSALVDSKPKYTAVELGRADDGAGSVHVAETFVWKTVRELQTRGITVTYDNFGVGGAATADVVTDAGAPVDSGGGVYWLDNAVALGGDLVILHFGMNEIANAGTAGRMFHIINTYKNDGREVIVSGVPRRQGNVDVGWRYTNQALARVARFTQSAFLSDLSIYEDTYLGAIGITLADVCSANNFNHPGFVENGARGRALTRLLVG